ncbi:hypothetical protein [Arthrobacter sp. StoSoilB13]|uniref:hypothetical protein n=1 Tax=Arthrobacter sp. StoSoilB13 TaxID=2830993 RepID=UPI001CC59485|nr:hypothetical protein [Arthrobacter sp. StoSoilB13]BCW47943.1 hypothetical protein StoSoilB13_02850 [Arthrobacter sp. StoSoilB13]
MTWGWFKRKAKPQRQTWDGQHNLKYVLFERFYGSTPQDYLTGWIWKCSCGTGTSLPFRYAYTESQAAAEFVEHARLYA